MAKTKTSFDKDNQPKQRKPRGKSERTKILESFKRCGKTENGFYDLLTEKAFNPEDQFSFKELLSRLSPIPKAVAPLIKFSLRKDGTVSEKIDDILEAIANGELPPDMGHQLMASMQVGYKVKDLSDFEEQLQALEAMIKEKDSAK